MGSFSFSWGNRPLSVERDSSGRFTYTLFDSSTEFKSKLSEAQKLKMVLCNPPALKVLSLNCDIFSLGNINKYKDEQIEIPNILYTLKDKPNFKQSWTQLLWDYMFWKQMGTAYLWNPGESKNIANANLQFLNPANIEWDVTILDKLRALIFTNKTYKEILQGTVKYNIGNGQSKLIPLSEITPFFDLSNGINPDGNFYKGASRIDALYKVIQNSEAALDSKNINIRYAGKFMVAGSKNLADHTQLIMGETEKMDIEQKMNGNKSVHAVKDTIDIKRFVEDLKKLDLDNAFVQDYMTIGSMLNTPKEILDIGLKGNTYENQEKAMMRHIEYGMKPGAQMLTDHLESQFGLNDVRMGWEQLSCNQFAELDRAAKIKVQLENIQLAVNLGMDANEAKKLVKTLQLT